MEGERSMEHVNHASPSLGELLRQVELAQAGAEVPEHDILDVTDLHPNPSTPFILSFHHLSYSVKTRRKLQFRSLVSADDTLPSPELITPDTNTKPLLNDVSGEAKEGEITAILGASGAGKSTLIDALANRISRSSLKGSIKLNGAILDSKLSKMISAYVMQEDLLFPMLTVEETLTFAAELRLPRQLNKAKRNERIQALIDQLGLRRASATIIGDEGHRGISGGERRRVSIGVDIIHDPILLFLDEPTSGLDSTSAFMVVKVLKRIAQSGSIVMMTVHQPSYRILNQIDHLVFLSRGEVVYSGSPGSLPAFFTDFGRPVHPNDDRSEFVLDLVRELETSPGGTTPLVEFNKARRMDRHISLSQYSIFDAIVSKGKLVTNENASTMSKFPNSVWKETAVIGRRSWLNARRTPELFAVRLGAVLITGIILATIFWKLDDSPRGIQERLGFFAFAMSTTFYTCAEAMPVFLQERYIFMRETAYNAYRRSSYVLAQSITSIPSLFLLSLVFSLITFWSVGLAGGLKGFLFYFATILSSFWAGSSFVTFLSGVVSHVMLGFTVVVAVLAYFLLFSGFFVTPDRIPPYWIWFHYLSLVKYPYEGVLENEFSDPTRCFVKGLQMFDRTPLATLPDVMKGDLLQSMSGVLGVNISGSSCVMTGEDILKQQGITDLGKWSCIWITISFGLFFRFLFYVALLLGSRNKRA